MDRASAQELLAAYGMPDRIERCDPLEAGYSDDVKRVLWVDGAPVYLLRLSAIDILPRRRAEFDALAAHYERGVSCPRPLAFGRTPDGAHSFMLLEYIVGEDAESALPRLPEWVQYEIGLQAGRELHRMHELEGAETPAEWFERRLRKHRRYMERAKELGLTYPGCERVERYVEEHLDLVRRSPVRFQHDDFHPANLIVADGGPGVGWRLAGVIDFNRCDWGDPVEDFYKAPFFGEPVSVPFINGQVRGYLACGETADFWTRYNLLTAMMLLPSVVWMHSHPPREGMAWWLGRIGHILETHDFEGDGPPTWFRAEPFV
jgi:aminoglycoside phosphotransferase (APT) family kinase protein